MSAIRLAVCVVLVLSLALIPSLAGCVHASGPQVVGSGVARTEVRDLSDFTRVEARGAFRLEVQAGGSASQAVLEGDDNLVALFETRVVDGALELGFPSGSYTTSKPFVVRVTAPRVESVQASGAIHVWAAGLAGERFEATLAGSCQLEARGAVRRAVLEASGAGGLDASLLEAEVVEVELSGSLQADVQATRNLRVVASGACTVRYSGAPTVESRTSGTSQVRPR
ncbi:MAG: DUF2807 domain-containing protein [Planctomycetes bacterium]|nr:DUF2807 domain-containing protein [Planctomycetota bacterium]